MSLATLEAVKEYLTIKGTADDALLERLISAASGAIDQYLGRQFESAAHSDVIDGNGGTRLTLRHYPITAIASLTIDGASIPVSTSPSVNGYFFSGRVVDLRGYRFSRGQSNVAITYTAGFATVPADVTQACIEMVSLRFKERDRIGLQSKVLAGETVSYFLGSMSDSAKRVLQQYRNVVPV